MKALETDRAALQAVSIKQHSVLESKVAAAMALAERLDATETESHSLSQQVRLSRAC